jgi:hypothetical protein
LSRKSELIPDHVTDVEVLLPSVKMKTVASWLQAKSGGKIECPQVCSWFSGVVQRRGDNIVVKFDDDEIGIFPVGWPMRTKQE